MLRTLIFALALAIPTVAKAQDWSWVDTLIVGNLTDGTQPLASYFFPNHADPAQATRALGIAYVYLTGSAGNAAIEVGLFEKIGGAWRLHKRVSGLFGQSPRLPKMHATGVMLTTDMLGPNDARCCPTAETRWFVNWADGMAAKIN